MANSRRFDAKEAADVLFKDQLDSEEKLDLTRMVVRTSILSIRLPMVAKRKTILIVTVKVLCATVDI